MKKYLLLTGLALTTFAFADNKNMVSVDVGDIVNQDGNFKPIYLTHGLPD